MKAAGYQNPPDARGGDSGCIEPMATMQLECGGETDLSGGMEPDGETEPSGLTYKNGWDDVDN